MDDYDREMIGIIAATVSVFMLILFVAWFMIFLFEVYPILGWVTIFGIFCGLVRVARWGLK